MSQTESLLHFTVAGMTCEHCVLSVTEEVSDVEGVEAVEVDLPSGRLVVHGDPSADQVRAAVAEAGYEITS